jgi:hypothetical protein
VANLLGKPKPGKELTPPENLAAHPTWGCIVSSARLGIQ